MQSLKWKDLKGKQVAVHCPTQELADLVGEFMYRNSSFDRTYKDRWWNSYEEEFCLTCEDGCYCNRDYFRNNNHSIISAIDFLSANGISYFTLNYMIL